MNDMENFGCHINHDHNHEDPSFPRSIRELLESLIGRRVIIVLESGVKQLVKIRAVSGNILIADLLNSCHPCSVKFVDIECICEVIAHCQDILQGLVDHD